MVLGVVCGLRKECTTPGKWLKVWILSTLIWFLTPIHGYTTTGLACVAVVETGVGDREKRKKGGFPPFVLFSLPPPPPPVPFLRLPHRLQQAARSSPIWYTWIIPCILLYQQMFLRFDVCKKKILPKYSVYNLVSLRCEQWIRIL